MTSCIGRLPDSKVTPRFRFLFWSLRLHHTSEELTLRMASIANVLNWLTQLKGPHLVDGMSTPDSLTALAILVTPEALYDPDSPRVRLGLVYKASYIQATSFSEAYFFLKLASQAEVSNRTTSALIVLCGSTRATR